MENKYCGFTCFWRIENFCACRPNRNLCLESPVFQVKMLNHSAWHLQLEQQMDGPLRVLDLNLYKDNPGNSNIIISMYIFRNSDWWTTDIFQTFFKFRGCEDGFGTDNLVSWDDLKFSEDVLTNGSLTVAIHMYNGAAKNEYAQCFMTSRMIDKRRLFHLDNQNFGYLPGSVEFPASNVSMFQNTFTLSWPKDLIPKKVFFELPKEITVCQKTTSSTQTETTEDNNAFKESDSLACLFTEKTFGIVTLRKGDKDFAVHKALLCSKSPVFNAMFDKDMKENYSNIVDIEDVDSDTLSLLVQFLYLERLDSLDWDQAGKLYYVADKYKIEVLKQKCLTYLKKEISTENICETFVIADMHQDEELKQSALEYFCKNSKLVIPSEEWKDFMSKRMQLCSEILTEFANKL